MNNIIAGKNNSGQRIDKFLKEEIFFNGNTTRGEIVRNIKEGNVLVNKKTVKPSYILKGGDKVETNIPEKIIKLRSNEKIKFKIIFEDKNFVVINKPAGLTVHPSSAERKDTLASGLLAKFPEIENVGDAPEVRPGIVHRLDKDTSGIMIAARNRKTFLELKNKFKRREVKKTYWAVVHGNLGEPGSSGIIDKPIARSADYKKQTVAGTKTKTKIREAVTEYKIIKKFADYSLVEVSPKTGRMHQIRVHLKSIGHPIVGDKIYKLKRYSGANDAGRQLLHAKELSFNLFGKKYYFETDVSGDMKKFLDSLTNAGNEDRI
ncbi:MAG: Pseudouridine synthase [Patescibacteria group bacterium]|nr:Pseudouridine synthase [Patescibacteria group bacterium]